MRRAIRTLALCAAAALLADAARASGWESIESLPGRAAENVTVQGKPRVYFRLTSSKPLSVTIAGPAQLRIISRAVLAGAAKQVVSYQIQALERGRVLGSMSEETSAAREASAPGVAALGKSRRLRIDLPDGLHEIKLVLAGASEALVRLQRSAPEGAEAWVSLAPVRARRSVAIVEGEKSIEYYSAFPRQPVRLRLVGPTTLDLLTRLDFDETMRGIQSYRLRLTDKGRVLREVEFKTTKAVTAAFANLADRVPSKFDRLSLPLGGGLHEIEISIVSPTGGVAEIHARIPQPSVGNTE